MTPILILVALAASMPNTDPQKICQSARVAALPEDRAGAYDSCLHDEQAARDQLRQRWAKFSAAARATCAEPQVSLTSYVEMLTCLEMQSGSDFGTAKQLAPTTAAPPPIRSGAPAQKP